MSMTVEKLEKGMAKLTIEVSAERFDEALKEAYKKNVGKINVPGFRKGKAPMSVIEKMYGTEIFYEDAANILIPDAYEEELKDAEVEPVARPSVDVVQLEKGKSFIFTATVAIKPEVTLGKYKKVKVEALSAEVSDDEVMAELKKEQDKNAVMEVVEDAAAELDNTVTIDFEGFVDGVAFEGGKGTDYPLVLGSHSFIDTFEDQLVGKKTGDEVDVNVTFPEQYQAEELAGKPALFKVVVKKIEKKVLPEIDDELAQDVSEFETLDEYKADIKAKLIEKKEKENKAKKEDAVIEQIIEASEMEIADDMIMAQSENMLREFAQNMQMQGLSLEQYMQFTGNTPQAMLEQMKPQALKRIQSRLVLEAVAAAENIEVSDEEVDEKIEEMAKMYGMDAATIKESVGEAEINQMKEDIKVEKAVELVTDAAVEK
ncbi:MAG: trigger factor [Lachnospiraceae bacterium]|nr:trigger factor [Lachnospiraceae bacterium]